MFGTDPSSPIDFTTSDNGGSCSQASDIESQSSRKVSLKRRLSNSLMEDLIDHDQLQASIEHDVLDGVGVHPIWSSGKISKPHLPQTQSMTPSFPQDHSTISAMTSEASLDNECACSFKFTRPGASRQKLGISRASYLGQPNTEDLYMLHAKPADFPKHPAKRLRSNYSSTSSMRTTLTNGQGHEGQTYRSPIIPHNDRLEISQNDYLEDEGLEAFLRSTAPSTSEIDIETELLPDTEKEIVELEMEEAAQAVQEDEAEDEASNEFMNVIAVDETNQDLMDIIEISSDEDDQIVTERRKMQPRSHRRKENRQPSAPNVSLESNNSQLQEIQHGYYTYKVGHGVEFYNGTFMRIHSIYRGHHDDVTLSGPLLIRHLHHVLDAKQPQNTRLFPPSGRQNEVIWTVTIDGTPRRENAFVQRRLSEAMCTREIVFTNQSWPCVSSQAYAGGRQRGSSLLMNEGTLFCRWKRVKQVELKQICQDYEESIERLTEGEADAAHSIKSSKLRFALRRQHVKAGGSTTYARQSLAVDGSAKTETVTQYTFADCFCGCGGASRGAEMASLAVQWAIDADEKAAQSYRANFKSVTFYNEDISDLLSRLGEPGATAAFMVDVLHMSPPCQAFSPARTRGCPTAKEHLEALILSVGDLLRSIKPRIATMEETAGLLTRNKDWVARVIRSIIDNGYSIRWKIVRGETLGVPQMRKRVVIIAAGPGEVLPPFPKPTHGPGSALKRPLTTIHDAIGNIPPRATHNHVASGFQKVKFKAAFSSHTQAKTITCGGGDNYHPSGLRSYTARELASLQTFPFLHSFGNANLTTAKKQIGNAYPPALARAVFKGIIQSLKEADGVQ